MAKQTILTGTVANDKTGDTIRAAFTKVNANFTELYNIGVQGTQGTTGAQGITGAQGTQGAVGSGSQGTQGTIGSQGIQGTRATEDRLINGSYEVVLNATGELTFPEGANITDTATTIIITPPGAAAGQSLVIRPTSSTWTVTSSGYIEYGNPITISVNLLSWAYFGTVNYEITGTGVTQQSLGRALTGSVVFTGLQQADSQEVTWTIPANSNITEFTFTITGVEGTRSNDIQVENDPALYYNFESNALPTGNYVTVTNNGISNSEHSHVHLISGNSVTTDIYLGDDDQFVKIEKNGGDVVIGTNTNTKNWRFDTNGDLTLPAAGDILDSTGESQFISISGLKTLVSDSTDFADFKTKIAAL
jgi:hypothetical protein